MAVWIILQGQGVITVEGMPPTAFARGDTLLLPGGVERGPRSRQLRMFMAGRQGANKGGDI